MNNLISLKITIEQDASNYLLFGEQICRSLAQLEAFCTARSQQLLSNGASFRYYWIDDDEDQIRITTEEDYRSFLQAMGNVKARLYAATVMPPPVVPVADTTEGDSSTGGGEATVNRPRHPHVICDVCDKVVVGHRYKCLTCHDYDLCMQCEGKFRHKDHLMVRIPKPEMVRTSHSLVTRMFEKMRVYAGRITTGAENDMAAAAAAGDTPGATEPPTTDDCVPKCAYASGAFRKQQSKPNAASPGGGDGRPAADSKKKSSHRTLPKESHRVRELWYLDPVVPGPIPSPSSSSSLNTGSISLAKAAAISAAASAQQAADALQQALNVTANITAAKNGTATAAATTQCPLNQTPKTPGSSSSLAPHPFWDLFHQEESARPQPPPPVVATTESPLFAPFAKLLWPTNEQLLAASAQVSKLLDPLGLNFEVRHKGPGGCCTADASTSPPSSSDCTAKDAADPAAVQSSSSLSSDPVEEPEEEEEEQHANASETEPVKNSVQLEPPAAEGPTGGAVGEAEQMAAVSDKPPSLLELDAVVPKSTPEQQEQEEEEEEEDEASNNSSASSASLLTDDDQDLIDVAEEYEAKASSSSSPPSTKSGAAAEKTWTLIDIPPEQDEEEERNSNVPLDAIAKLIGGHEAASKAAPAPPPEQQQPKEKRKSKSGGGEEKVKEPTKKTSSSASSSPPPTSIDYENLGKMLAKHMVEEEGKQQKEKKASPASSSSTSPPASAAGSGRSGKGSSRKSSSSTAAAATSTSTTTTTTQQQPKDHTVYSYRPHVNHAIHTMMTMGFSNHNGWLTQLLESLNGDIPKALDLLLQHRH